MRSGEHNSVSPPFFFFSLTKKGSASVVLARAELNMPESVSDFGGVLDLYHERKGERRCETGRRLIIC